MATTLADLLTIGIWAALALLGFLCGAMQRRGRDYYPANLLIGLSFGSQGVFYLGLLAAFHGDVGTLRAWALASRAGLYLSGGEIALVLWALWLVWKVNHGRAGSSADLAGHLSTPPPEMVDEALAVIRRADQHGLLTTVTRDWLREERIIRRRRREAKAAGGEDVPVRRGDE